MDLMKSSFNYLASWLPFNTFFNGPSIHNENLHYTLKNCPLDQTDTVLRKYSHFITTEAGHKLRVVTLIPDSNAQGIIFFVHGMGGQAGNWIRQLAEFSSSHVVIALDWVGNGLSDRALQFEPYQTENIALDLANIIAIERKSLPGHENIPLVLVGHSYGTALVVHLARKVTPSKIVLLSPKAPERDPQKLSQAKRLVHMPDVVLEAMRLMDRRGGVNSTSVSRFVHPMTTPEVKRAQLLWNAAHETATLKRVVHGSNFPDEEDYQNISVPVFIITGQDDHVTPVEDTEKVKSLLTSSPSVQVEILPETGHSVMIEKPSQVNQLLRNFI